MPEILDQIPKNIRGRTMGSKYDEYLDGQIRKFTPKEVSQIATDLDAFRTGMYSRALATGKKVSILIDSDGNAIVFLRTEPKPERKEKDNK